MNRSRSITVILATLAFIAATSHAVARPHDGERKNQHRERVERPERPRVAISLDQAVAMAERRFNARVVRAEQRESGDRLVYVLRLLNDSGRVWTVKVDATTGAMH
jgi:uncharacterized membrane protein YkoI